MPVPDERSPLDWLIGECLNAVRAHGPDMPAVQLRLAEALHRLSEEDTARLTSFLQDLGARDAAAERSVN